MGRSCWTKIKADSDMGSVRSLTDFRLFLFQVGPTPTLGWPRAKKKRPRICTTMGHVRLTPESHIRISINAR